MLRTRPPAPIERLARRAATLTVGNTSPRPRYVRGVTFFATESRWANVDAAVDVDELPALRDGKGRTGPNDFGSVTFRTIAAAGRGMPRRWQAVTGFARARCTGKVGPNRQNRRRIDERGAVASYALAASAIPGWARTPFDGAPGEDELDDAIEVARIAHGARHEMTTAALRRSGHRRHGVRAVRAALRPRVGLATMTSATRSASVAEVNTSVHVQRSRGQL